MNHSRVGKTVIAAAIAASIAIACAVAQSLAAPSEGLKKPPTAQLKNFDIETLASGFDQPIPAHAAMVRAIYKPEP